MKRRPKLEATHQVQLLTQRTTLRMQPAALEFNQFQFCDPQFCIIEQLIGVLSEMQKRSLVPTLKTGSGHVSYDYTTHTLYNVRV